MSKVAVVYWSGTGNTEAMANAVAAGAKDAGAEVSVFTASEFDAGKAAEFGAIAFGCPSMGVEQLEESEFEPMFDEVKGSLGGKKVGLFGSYGWGDGEWMRTWESSCRDAGINLVSEGVICNEAPDDEAEGNCRELGKSLA
ncbi:MAG: flavodoxin [Clostridiales bacterium]|nr:flavodoxin [Clostridiales bacterium]